MQEGALISFALYDLIIAYDLYRTNTAHEQ